MTLAATFAAQSTVTFCKHSTLFHENTHSPWGAVSCLRSTFPPPSVLLNAFSKTLCVSLICHFLNCAAVSEDEISAPRTPSPSLTQPQSIARNPQKHSLPAARGPGGGRGPRSPRTCLLPGQGSGLRFLAFGQMENALDFQFPNPQGGASTLQGLDLTSGWRPQGRCAPGWRPQGRCARAIQNQAAHSQWPLPQGRNLSPWLPQKWITFPLPSNRHPVGRALTPQGLGQAGQSGHGEDLLPSTGVSFASQPCAHFCPGDRQLGPAQNHTAGESWARSPPWVYAPNQSRAGLRRSPHSNILDTPEAHITTLGIKATVECHFMPNRTALLLIKNGH